MKQAWKTAMQQQWSVATCDSNQATEKVHWQVVVLRMEDSARYKAMLSPCQSNGNDDAC